MTPEVPPEGRLARHGGRLFDVSVALGLIVATTAVLFATNDIGFVRDEAFYFAHSETYQEWFVRFEDAEQRADALRDGDITRTWRNNHEHPPLNKILAGYAWRLFGRKLRPIGNLRRLPKDGGGGIRADVERLAPAQGFEIGARVNLLAPQLVGVPDDLDARLLVTATVHQRDGWRATLLLDEGLSIEQLLEACRPAGSTLADGLTLRTTCEAVEQRPAYLMSESDAMRLPAEVFAGLLIAALWLVARGLFGGVAVARPFALLAAVGWLCLPRTFFHAHLSVFDTTITALLFMTTVAWYRALRSPAWILPAALLWGVSLLAKHNALVLPLPLLVHWLWDASAEGRFPPARLSLARSLLALVAAVLAWPFGPLVAAAVAVALLWDGREPLRLPAVPRVFFAMLFIGPMLLFAGWPLLWVDPADNLMRWIEFHVHHEHYMQTWFHQVLAYPPFPVVFPVGMTLLTWTLPLLVAFAIGLPVVALPPLVRGLRILAAPAGGVRRIVDRIRLGHYTASAANRDHETELANEAGADAHLAGAPRHWPGVACTAAERGFDRLILLSIIWPIGLIAMPSTPIFGGVKHWVLAWAFMLLVAARGLDTVWRLLAWRLLAWRQRVQDSSRAGCWRRRAGLAVLPWLMTGLVLLPSAQATWDVHPHGTAYYNELIGGIPGAAEAGMQRQFWGGATRSGLDEVNRLAPRGARVWFHNAAWGSFQMYAREGSFRSDLRYGGDPGGSAMGFYHHQKDHDDYELEAMQSYHVRSPVMQVSIEGVPMLSVYRRPPPR